MASMISFQDHLRSLLRLLYDARLRRVWPGLAEEAGLPLLLRRFHVMECADFTGAQIKHRYRDAATMPDAIKALKDSDRYISVLVVFKKAESRSGFGCMSGVFDVTGRAIGLSCGEVYAHDALKALHFRHLFPDCRRSSREELMADLAERLRAVVAAVESSLMKRGIDTGSIGLTRTRELLSGLESGAESQCLLLLLHGFVATMLDHESHVLNLEEAGLLPPGAEAEMTELVRRLRFVLS